MLDQLPKPAIIAHRGASKYAPENTIAAFSLAAEQGADGIELDAKLSKDGEVVVIHDRSVNRTTNGRGKVAKLTLEELRRLDAGSWFGEQFAGETIPTLAEVLEVIAPRLRINIELTNYASRGLDALPIRAAELIREYGVEDRVWISSFSFKTLWRFTREMPEIPVGVLLSPRLIRRGLRGKLRSRLPHNAFHPHHWNVDREIVQVEHTKGNKLYTWTVNKPERMNELFEMGVDGIITDDPIAALKIREEAGL